MQVGKHKSRGYRRVDTVRLSKWLSPGSKCGVLKYTACVNSGVMLILTSCKTNICGQESARYNELTHFLSVHFLYMSLILNTSGEAGI